MQHGDAAQQLLLHPRRTGIGEGDAAHTVGGSVVVLMLGACDARGAA